MSVSQSKVRTRQTEARYDCRGAVEPPNGLARPKASLATRTAVGLHPDPKTGKLIQHVRQAPATRIGAVKDPTDPRGLARSTARIHTHTDILELEHSHNRISVGAYRTGRFVMAVFERAHGLSRDASNLEPKDSADQTFGHEAQVIRSLDTAREVVWWTGRIEKAIGRIGCRMLRRVLDDGLTFRDLAAERGRGTSERAISQTASQFRTLLEDLAEDLSTKGGRR